MPIAAGGGMTHREFADEWARLVPALRGAAPQRDSAAAEAAAYGLRPTLWLYAGHHLAALRQVESGLEGRRMPVRYQLVIDCADPDLLARFWAAALGYELAPVPAGFATWNDFYRELGVPEGELVDGADRISDPEGQGPSIWFHLVTDAKTVKNRLHLDVHAGGEWTDPIETRRKRVDAEATRLAGLGATITGALSDEGLDHYAVGMKDPEGNEFDIN
jgi:hypothetical protein